MIPEILLSTPWLTIRSYGVIIGLALLVGYWIAQWLVSNQSNGSFSYAKKFRNSDILPTLFFWGVLGGIVGSRAWHVMTDWSLYAKNVSQVAAIWQGGLSIFGAVVGGSIGVIGGLSAVLRRLPTRQEIVYWLDVLAVSLPFAQAIGRLGNYVNQELYGLPTTLPWGIFITPVKRFERFRDQATFHPLFAYEMILDAVLGFWLIKKIRHSRTQGGQQLGSGALVKTYLLIYGTGRWALDFLRVDRGVTWSGLGVNQWVLTVICVTLLLSILTSHIRAARARRHL